MRLFGLVPLMLLAGAGCASTQMASHAMPETGYTPGALGFVAIMDEDWARAERQLLASHAAANDPARLLNLAHVYRSTGRETEARRLYSAVLDQRDRTVELANGEPASCHALARKALAQPTGVAERR